MLSFLFHYSLLQNIACSALCYTVVLVGCLFYTCYCVSVNPRGCCYLGPQGPCPSAMASWYRLPFPFLPHPLQLAVIISHPISLDRLFPKNACQRRSPGWPWWGGEGRVHVALRWVHRLRAGPLVPLPADQTCLPAWGIPAGASGPALVSSPLFPVFHSQGPGDLLIEFHPLELEMPEGGAVETRACPRRSWVSVDVPELGMDVEMRAHGWNYQPAGRGLVGLFPNGMGRLCSCPRLSLGGHTAGQPASPPLIVSGHLGAVGKGLCVLVQVSLSLLPEWWRLQKPTSAW